MNHLLTYAKALARSPRLVFFVATTAVNTALFSGIAGLFDSASSIDWLAPTQDNVERVAACDEARGTPARHACVAAIVADVQGQPASGAGVRIAVQDLAAPLKGGATAQR